MKLSADETAEAHKAQLPLPSYACLPTQLTIQSGHSDGANPTTMQSLTAGGL